MKFNSIQLKEYKSIKDSGELILNNKLNVLAGKNNAGKTAIIQALSMFFRVNNLVGFFDITNQEKLALQEKDISRRGYSTLILKFSLNKKETEDLIGYGGTINCNFKIILKANNYHVAIQEIEEENDIFSIRNDFESEWYSIYNRGETSRTMGIPQKGVEFFNHIKNNLVYIQSTRVLPESDDTHLHEVLRDNGANLHSYFFTLHNNNEDVFDHIEEIFQSIFTDVESLKTAVVKDGKTSIHIKFEGETDSYPLHECGSGYTHVLIMLCILYTTKDKIVLYDEPHLYLHPSAEKAIYDLVNMNDNLQFIFTTHSPILINYPMHKSLILVKKVEGYSSYSLMDTIQDVLLDIGIRNGDFALADKVLFVEGETEEKLIPVILAAFGMQQIGYNYKILNMKGTGNAFSKSSAMTNNAQKLTQIFTGLASSPIPYCILIDRDERSEEQISRLKQNYKENIVILDKREIENYFLLNSTAITTYLKQSKKNNSITNEDVQSFINDCYSKTEDTKLFPKSKTCPENDIVGSEVLERLFDQHDCHYNKVDDGYALTIEILRNESGVLQPIAEQLQSFIKDNEK